MTATMVGSNAIEKERSARLVIGRFLCSQGSRVIRRFGDPLRQSFKLTRENNYSRRRSVHKSYNLTSPGSDLHRLSGSDAKTGGLAQDRVSRSVHRPGAWFVKNCVKLIVEAALGYIHDHCICLPVTRSREHVRGCSRRNIIWWQPEDVNLRKIPRRDPGKYLEGSRVKSSELMR
jgi:hypothetical protein